ncbi:hypothetical protein [Micromonospora sp. NPDC050276]|uniref:hypothetical protein n=1 Tax=Micromonospora sp. NPDC050276 TaxID=3364278 RepID=UPI0037B40602
MTHPLQTGAVIIVLSPLNGSTIYHLLPKKPEWQPTLTDEYVTFTDPLVDITAAIFISLKTGTGCLAADPDRCPLCYGDGVIRVRLDLTDTTTYRTGLLWALLDNGPQVDEFRDADRPCPACHLAAFHLASTEDPKESD